MTTRTLLEITFANIKSNLNKDDWMEIDDICQCCCVNIPKYQTNWFGEKMKICETCYRGIYN